MFQIEDAVISRSRTALLRSLSRRRTRDDEGIFIAEGVRVVEDLLDAGLVLRFALVSSSLEDTERGQAVLRRLEAACEVERVGEGELTEMAQTVTPQGVVVVAEQRHAQLEELVVDARAVLLVLDRVQDPGNMGTLLRTAEALGVRGAIALPGSVDAWNGKVVRAAAGSVFRLPVVELSEQELIAWLARERITLLAAEAGGEPIGQADGDGAVALVVGNEGWGLGEGMARAADARVSVPMRGAAESLNVSVAAGILLHELTRRREGDGTDR